MIWVLVGGIAILCIKFWAMRLTGSVAIFSDALESIVNVLSGSVALFSLLYAAKPKDEDHPYGHGKIEFISAGFEGALILIAGIVMIYKGGNFLLHPHELTKIDYGILLVILAGLANGIMGVFLVKKGKLLNSPSLFADGKHLLSDTYTSIGLILSLVLINLTDWVYFDGIVSIIMGIWVLIVGFRIIKNSVASLLDKADTNRIEHIIQILNKNRRTKWIDIHNFRVQKYGSHLHIDCHVTLPWYDTLEESHEEVSKVREIVAKETNYDIEFFIHSDPCIPISCSICSISSCLHRQNEFSQTIDWSVDNLIPNKKHTI